MRELDDAALERRLRGVLKEHLGALPLDLTVDALDRRREAKGVARRFGRGRGMTLLAAAALLLVGGALAAGSGLLRLPSVVPPVPDPSVVAVATASPDATSPSPSESAAPSASPIPVAGPGGVWIPTGTMARPTMHTRGAASRWQGAGGRRRSRRMTTDDLRGAVRPRQRDVVRHREACSGPLTARPATLLRDGRVLVGEATTRR